MQLDIAAASGRLEGILDEPQPAGAEAGFAAVVCHPHPRFGGTMHNSATYRIAKAVQARGGVSLRFNFRGVGLSAGSWDEGRGESDDARAALDWLAREHPALPLFACGFSFGAWMAVIAGGPHPRVKGLLLAGVALRPGALPTRPSSPARAGAAAGEPAGAGAEDIGPIADAAALRHVDKPIAIVQAEADEFASPGEVHAAVSSSPAPRRIAVVAGASHLFAENLGALQREAEAGVDWLRGEAT